MEASNRARTTTWLMGHLCLWAGLLGAASGVLLAVVPAQVDAERFSYPLTAFFHSAIQIWFVVQHLGLIAGMVGLARSGAMGSSRPGRAGLRVAIVGMAILTVTELAAVGGASLLLTDPFIAILNVGYGVSTFLVGIGLIVAGVVVVRAGRWRGSAGWLPLGLGVWVFVPMTPALAMGFIPARLSITGWMLLFAALGWQLMRQPESVNLAKPGMRAPDGAPHAS